MLMQLFKNNLGLKTIGVLIGLILGGCDYWPPALHQAIDELRNDLHDALDERQRLDNDNAELRDLQASLQREVEEKGREIDDLRSRLAQPAGPSHRSASGRRIIVPPTPPPQRTLAKRNSLLLQLQDPMMNGGRVTHVQRLLRRQGFPIHVNAVYGQDTVAAGRAFQRNHGLLTDGVVGPETERALRRKTYAPKLSRQLRLKRPPLTGQDVIFVQRALRRAGHRVTIDGRFGPETDIAVIRFQQRHGLESDGVVDPRTWAALIRKR